MRNLSKKTYCRSASILYFLVIVLAFTLCAFRQPAYAQLNETQTRYYYNSKLTINHLYEGNTHLGHVIWINRLSNRLKAKYFASGDVYNKFKKFDKDKHVALVCSGAFTTNRDGKLMPKGITVDNGITVNRARDKIMDGLVIVYATGGIVVSDLEKEYLFIYENDKKHKLDLLKSEHKTLFLNWANRAWATVFQTQLLASENSLRLSVSKANKWERERRLLALVKNSNDQVYHVIFNIKKHVYLGKITLKVLNYLRYNKSFYVYSILNLDTGDYDILRVNDENGRQLSDIKGPKSISIATNLLVYYYE